MRKPKFGLAVLALYSLATGSARAYPENYGPFEKGGEPKRFPVQECDVLERLEPKEKGGLPTLVFGPKGWAAGPRVRVEQPRRKDGGFASSLTVLDTKGERRAGPVPIGTGAGVGRVLHADFNGDKREDFVALAPGGGCGLACHFYTLAFVLSVRDFYVVTLVEDMAPGPEDFIDIGDGRAGFVQTSFVHGDTEIARDGKKHNYWVHSLLAFEEGCVVVDNAADARFPAWIWYTHDPNHKATTMLTGEQKQRLWAREVRIFPQRDLPGLRGALSAHCGRPGNGPAPSPCGRWEACTGTVEKGKTFGVFVRRAGARESRRVLVSCNSLRAFWTKSKERTLLVVNHHRVSNSNTVHVHDPRTGRTWQPDEKAIAALDKLAPTGHGFGHLFSDAAACSSDGAKLLLHVHGHEGGLEASQYYVVSIADGRILATYEKRGDVREPWAGEAPPAAAE